MRSPSSSTLTASALPASRTTSALFSSFPVHLEVDVPRPAVVLYCGILRRKKCVINPDNETKIKLIEDRDASGEVAAGLRRMACQVRPTADARHFEVLQPSPRLFARCDEIQRHRSLFPRSSGPQNEGSDCELGIVAQSLSILTGLACILPACSGSRRETVQAIANGKSGRSRLESRRACVA